MTTLIDELEEKLARRTLRFLKKIKYYQAQFEHGEISEELLIKRTRERVKSLSYFIEHTEDKIKDLMIEQRFLNELNEV